MSAMVVRPARPSDAAVIQVIYQDLVPGDRNIAVSPERIVQIEQDPHSVLLVVEVEGDVSGSAFLTIGLDPMYGFQPYGVIET